MVFAIEDDCEILVVEAVLAESDLVPELPLVITDPDVLLLVLLVRLLFVVVIAVLLRLMLKLDVVLILLELVVLEKLEASFHVSRKKPS